MTSPLPVLATKQKVADALHRFADSFAQWYLNVWSDREDREREAHLVVQDAAGERARWRVTPQVYNTILSEYARGGRHTYAIAAAEMEYHDAAAQAQIPALRYEVHFRGAPVLGRLHQLRYYLDDTPGILLSAAQAWWEQADELIVAFPAQALHTMESTRRSDTYRVDPTHYAYVLRQALQVHIPAMETFLLHVSFPAPLPPYFFYEPLSCLRHPALFETPVQVVIAEAGQAITRGDGSRYCMRQIYATWEFNASYEASPHSDTLYGTAWDAQYGNTSAFVEEEANYFDTAEVVLLPTTTLSSSEIRAQLQQLRDQLDHLMTQLPSA